MGVAGIYCATAIDPSDMKSSAQPINIIAAAEGSTENEHSHHYGKDAVVAAVADARRESDDYAALDTTIISGDTARMLKTLMGNLDGMVYRCREDATWTMEFIENNSGPITAIHFDRRHNTFSGAAAYYGEDYGIAW
jgi:hypothetical protein